VGRRRAIQQHPGEPLIGAATSFDLVSRGLEEWIPALIGTVPCTLHRCEKLCGQVWYSEIDDLATSPKLIGQAQELVPEVQRSGQTDGRNALRAGEHGCVIRAGDNDPTPAHLAYHRVRSVQADAAIADES